MTIIYNGSNNFKKYPNQPMRKANDKDLVNERIHFKEVLLIGPEGESFGVVPLKVAVQKSYDYEMDLLCVSPAAHPPVCKIVDYGKYKFDRDKKAKEAKKNQKKTVVREVQFKATTDMHDLQTKAKATIGFLEDDIKVKAVIQIRGRMMQRMDLVNETLNSFINLVRDYCVIDKEPELVGRNYSVMLSPKPNKAKPVKQQQEDKKDAKDEK